MTKAFIASSDSCLQRSHSKFVLKEAISMNFFGRSIVITCDETEAWLLLLDAGRCPSVVASIHKALRLPGIQIESF
jgi:hypothetical protein